MGLKRFWVPDLIGKLLPACNGLAEQATGLREIAAADGVHFTKHGYEKLAHTMVCWSKSLVVNSYTAKNSVSDAGGSHGSHRGGPKSFFWRGFVSPIGSERPRNHHAKFMLTHQGSGGGGKWKKGQNRDRGGQNRPPPYYQRFWVHLLTVSNRFRTGFTRTCLFSLILNNFFFFWSPTIIKL